MINAKIKKTPTFNFERKQKFAEFKKLWESYPKGKNGKNAQPSQDSYALNQCAIRVGVSLKEAGMDISGYPEVNQTSEGWPRSSKGLADWLWNEVRPPLRMSQQDFEANYKNSTGLIYLAPPTGGIGHIDLYNAGQTGSGYYLASEVWFWEIK